MLRCAYIHEHCTHGSRPLHTTQVIERNGLQALLWGRRCHSVNSRSSPGTTSRPVPQHLQMVPRNTAKDAYTVRSFLVDMLISDSRWHYQILCCLQNSHIKFICHGGLCLPTHVFSSRFFLPMYCVRPTCLLSHVFTVPTLLQYRIPGYHKVAAL